MIHAFTRALLYLFAGALVARAAALAHAAEPLEARLAACLACHGASGTSETPLVPSLGGQPEFFLTVQLLMFRDRLRVVSPMNEMLQGASDAELKAMAADLSKLPPPAPAPAGGDQARMDRAKAVIEQHRGNFCHGATYGGGDDDPLLAGQREDYLVKALRDYKSNARRGYDASMADVLVPIGDEELRDLAYFLSRQR